MGQLFGQGRSEFQLSADADAARGGRQRRRARALPPQGAGSFGQVLRGGAQSLPRLLGLAQVAARQRRRASGADEEVKD